MTPNRDACITLFTDASSCSKTRIATWSAWAKYRSTDDTMRRSGEIIAATERDILDMVYNEAYAIAAGVAKAVEAFSPPDGTLIVIQTDNQATTSLITGKGKPKFRARYQHVIDMFDAAIKEKHLRPAVRLVEGHRGTKTPRYSVNTWCDKECRRLLRTIRADRQEEMEVLAATLPA